MFLLKKSLKSWFDEIIFPFFFRNDFAAIKLKFLSSRYLIVVWKNEKISIVKKHRHINFFNTLVKCYVHCVSRALWEKFRESNVLTKRSY